MYNYKSQKSFKTVDIILLIAAFSFGVISCKNKPTKPSNLSHSLVEPVETGPVNPNDPDTGITGTDITDSLVFPDQTGTDITDSLVFPDPIDIEPEQPALDTDFLELLDFDYNG